MLRGELTSQRHGACTALTARRNSCEPKAQCSNRHRCLPAAAAGDGRAFCPTPTTRSVALPFSRSLVSGCLPFVRLQVPRDSCSLAHRIHVYHEHCAYRLLKAADTLGDLVAATFASRANLIHSGAHLPGLSYVQQLG